MIRIILKKMLLDKVFLDKQRITLNDVSVKTGISRPTLNRIANVAGYNTNTDTINKLCKYFKCSPCELLEYIEDED